VVNEADLQLDVLYTMHYMNSRLTYLLIYLIAYLMGCWFESWPWCHCIVTLSKLFTCCYLSLCI